jgi:hypothetical protein
MTNLPRYLSKAQLLNLQFRKVYLGQASEDKTLTKRMKTASCRHLQILHERCHTRLPTDQLFSEKQIAEGEKSNPE